MIEERHRLSESTKCNRLRVGLSVWTQGHGKREATLRRHASSDTLVDPLRPFRQDMIRQCVHLLGVAIGIGVDSDSDSDPDPIGLRASDREQTSRPKRGRVASSPPLCDSGTAHREVRPPLKRAESATWEGDGSLVAAARGTGGTSNVQEGISNRLVLAPLGSCRVPCVLVLVRDRSPSGFEDEDQPSLGSYGMASEDRSLPPSLFELRRTSRSLRTRMIRFLPHSFPCQPSAPSCPASRSM